MLDRLKNALFRSTMDASTDQCLDAVLADKSSVKVSRRTAVTPDALPGMLTPITYVLTGPSLAPIGGAFSWNPHVPLEHPSALTEGAAVTGSELHDQIITGAVDETRANLAGLLDLAPSGKPSKPKAKARQSISR